ncbi:WYL domain-containing protein [Peredibacter sp. HCB2-198]|uniref:WYL domain-containing protein n=1 Tax=Peredibacter sp. HCB2-198 TaxID=3383025 RepID=UPI0038B585D3
MKKSMKPDVWNKLVVLGEKQGAIRLSDLALEMGLGPEETLFFLRQVFPSGTGIEIYHQNSECWVDIKGEEIQYMLPLSPAEWMQLHQMLYANKTADTQVMHSLRKKVTENGPIKVVMELLNQLELWDQELNESEQQIVQQLDTAIVEKQLLCLATGDNRTFIVHPCRVLHLEGQLTLIAEDSSDHCLVVVPLKEVKEISSVPSSKVPKVSPYEVEEFISAIRAMNEKETRLILKIHDPGTTNLFPEHHFLGKPCMITNPNGDLIWAAYVEPCEALYDWLLTLGKNVEILDPVKFKDDYLIYCEEKLRKIA